MKINQIKNYLKNYDVIKYSIDQKQDKAIITGYRKKEVLNIDESLKKLIHIIELLIASIEDTEFIKYIQFCIKEKYPDKFCVSNVYLSSATSYRLKDKFFLKLLLLCAFHDLISEEEIKVFYLID